MSVVTRIIGRIYGLLYPFLYRLSRGQISRLFGGGDVLLITTTGGESDKDHTIAIWYLRDMNSLILIASNGGRPEHPSWCLNLDKDPLCLVQILGSRVPMIAENVRLEERVVLWDRAIAMYPRYADLQKRTDRLFPLVRLKKAS